MSRMNEKMTWKCYGNPTCPINLYFIDDYQDSAVRKHFAREIDISKEGCSAYNLELFMGPQL